MSARELITEHLDLWTGTVTKKSSSGRGSRKSLELYGIKKLRELILTLAFTGKLSHPLAAREDLDDLLESMAVERTQYHAKKGAREQKFKLIPDGNIKLDLPHMWNEAYFNDVIVYITDFQANGSFANLKKNVTYYDSPNYALLVRLTDLRHGLTESGNYKYTDKSGYDYLAKSSIEGGELVVANVGAGVGTTLSVPNLDIPATLAPNMFMVVLSEKVSKEYFLHYCQSPLYWDYIYTMNTGTGQPKINKTQYKNCKLPLPPLAEQRRIAQKIDELMSLCDRLEQQTSDQLEAHETLVDTLLGTLTQSENATELADNWARLAAHFDTLFTTEQSIDKLKQTILQLAVMGRLVEQYPNEISAHQLLNRIAERRRALIISKKIKNSKPLPPVAPSETTSELPRGWAWTRLGSIAEINPRNSGDDTREASFIPMPLVSTSYHGEHGDEPRNWGQIKKGYSHFANGDIGLAKITPCFENGKAAVFRDLRNGIGAGTTELHVARPISSAINPYFVLLFLKSPRYLREGEKVMTGSAGQKRVPKSYFAETPLPLPPEEEQHRIVQKVDELMALCDQLKERLNQASETRNQLAEAVVDSALN
ncbi:type I restriction enzyme S subunit [Marinobacter nauticus]|uniref:Type I restriction enzyme S subunit n=1 Tax=Marinobacter nauticus TaxID=2743 RepID=A0A368Y2T8_MARNT|nr:restriction endonuclease subunit S [Marinobacter nauticus]RCW73676.1 type I restriction enzyme S subunit [Marinobacter nauticus]